MCLAAISALNNSIGTGPISTRDSLSVAALALLVEVLHSHVTHDDVCLSALYAIKNVSGNPAGVTSILASHNAMVRLAKVLSIHTSNEAICWLASAILQNVCTVDAGRNVFVALKMSTPLVRVLLHHVLSPQACSRISAAILNIALCRTGADALIAAGVVNCARCCSRPAWS